MLDEYPGEYLVRRVSDLVGDLCDRKVRHLEKLTGSLHSQPRQVDPWQISLHEKSFAVHVADEAAAKAEWRAENWGKGRS